MAHEGRSRWNRAGRTLAAAALAVAILPLATPAAALEVSSATGLRATIHTADEIRATWLVEGPDGSRLDHPETGQVELASADGSLVPADVQRVAAALAAVQGCRVDLHVHVFLLPGRPAGVRSSFARRDAIYLAPTAGRPADETLAYEVVHELGHVLCWYALDGRPSRWQAYRELRGLAPQDDPASVPHAERHREIVAEDFRHLFGGPLATRSGTIENARLPLPDAVPGLRDLLGGYLATAAAAADRLRPSTVSPNPCRGAARVELALDEPAAKDAGPVVLEVHDLRGRLVRRVAGGTPSNGRASVIWDGTDAGGRRVAAGLYLYRIRAGRQNGAGRILMLDR